MAARDKEKYYWLKLKDTFFTDPEIRLLESGDNGKEYTLIYLKLMCLATCQSGYLRYNDFIPYDIDMLATLTNSNPDVLKGAMRKMTALGLIEMLDDNTIYMRTVAELLGSETRGAERKREYRESLKGDIVPRLSPNCPQEIDIDIEKDIDIEIDSRGPTRARPDIPTVDDVAAYCRERGNNVDAEHFYNYYDSQGWKKANGRPLTNWKAAVVTWEKKEGRYGPGENNGTGKKPAERFHIKYDND